MFAQEASKQYHGNLSNRLSFFGEDQERFGEPLAERRM
jgi:hypothetical protein